MREFAHPATWADMAAIVSFLAPIVGEGLGFLRILRTLRLLYTYQVIARLRADSSFFRRNEEVITAVVNIAVFLFIMTGFVYQTQHWRNPAIANYMDALYFTVTALTTTGFGDITLQGSLGRLTSVVIMIFGVPCSCGCYKRSCDLTRFVMRVPTAGFSATTPTLFIARPAACS